MLSFLNIFVCAELRYTCFHTSKKFSLNTISMSGYKCVQFLCSSIKNWSLKTSLGKTSSDVYTHTNLLQWIHKKILYIMYIIDYKTKLSIFLWPSGWLPYQCVSFLILIINYMFSWQGRRSIYFMLQYQFRSKL